MQDFD